MKLMRITEWIHGHGEDAIVNFDHVVKIENAAYDAEVREYNKAITGDDSWFLDACEEGLDFQVTKITFIDGETMLLHGSANEIAAKLKGGTE